jgi:hypothetical protein
LPTALHEVLILDGEQILSHLLAGRAIKDAPLALGENALNQRQLRSRTGITFSL